ncbi:hypothetical protein LBW59_24175, partial [Ralstonia solanacearum]|nr:hypothetical protein [Ralstonia solanacearum]
VDNGNGTLTQTTHYNNATFNAATTALAMLAGGGLASALGANAQSAADAAQNESVNNATAEHQRSLPANAGTGSATSLGELAGRFGRGVVGGLKGVFVEPFLQVRDIGAAGLSFGYNELMRGEKAPYWYPEMKSGVAEAYANGTSQGKLLLQSNPLTGVGVLSYDATTALAQGRYGDAAEMAGGFAAGTAVGAGVSRFGGYGLTFGDIGGPRYGSLASQRGAVSLRLVTPEDGVSGDVPVISNGTANSATGSYLREGLARLAGIPRSLNNVWGSSLNDLKDAYQMDGRTVVDKPARSSSSGNAQIFTVDAPKEGAAVVKEVQYSPESDVSQHGGQYYKFTYTDGSKVKVINPDTYNISGWPEKNTTFYDPAGNRIVYDLVTKTWRKK